MAIRLINVLVALLLGIGVTFALFFAMQQLISSGQEAPVQGERIRIADITIPQIQAEVNRTQPKPAEPEAPEEVPDLPEQTFEIDAPTTGPTIAINTLDVGVGAMSNNVSIGINDTEMLPIVTAPPQYPSRALSRGIEGWVLVSFTVTETGEVRDPVVIDAEPPDTFDRAAMRAVERFKYNPRVVNGQPVPVQNVQYVIRFNLAE